MLADKELTGRIIGAALNVHKRLGPGFLEAVYEEALAIEFDFLNVRFERQKPVPILYRDQPIGEHQLDFLVEEKVVTELKAVRGLEDIHFAIVRSYLKATDLQTGLLINFATMPLTTKRVGREDPARRSSVPDFLIS
jgi:GxxExxY protein